MITRLKLTNFRKHRDLELHFTDGLNVMRGSNFAGKSTILMAIMYALFGTRAVPGGKKVLVTHGESDCKVELFFEMGNEEYLIERTVNNATAYKGGNPVATSHSAVTEYVEGLLGMDLKRFLQLGYAQQSETAALVTLGAAALQKAVEDMSGLDLIDRVIKAAGKDVSKLEGQLEGQRSVDLEPLEAAVAQADQHELSSSYAVDTAMNIEAVAREDYESKRSALAAGHAANAKRSQIVATAARLSDAEAAAKAAQEELASLPEVSAEEAQARYAAAQEAAKTIEQQWQRKQEVQNEIQRVTEWFPYAEAQKKQEELVNAKLAHLDAQILGAQDDLRKAEDAKLLADQALKAARDAAASGVCGACNRPFEDHDPAEAEREIAAAEEKLAAATAEAARLKALVEKHQAERKAVASTHPGEGWAGAITEHEIYLKSLKQQLAEFEPGLGAESAAQARAGAEIAHQAYVEAYSAAQARQSALKRAQEAQAKVTALRQELSALGEMPDAVDVAPLQAAEAEAREAHDAARTQLAEAKTALQEAKYAAEAARKALADAKALNERLAKQEAELALLQEFVKHLRSNRAVFLAQVWETVMGIVTDFTRTVTEGAITNVRYEDGQFLFTENDVEAPVVAAASGGQKAIIGVGLRLAMEACFYGGRSALFFDEPSAELNDHFASLLAGALSANERQVVMITHRDAEEYAASNVLTIGEAA